MVFTRDNRQAVFDPTKSDCARPPSVFARFSTCWLRFVPKSEIPLEGASLWLDFGHPESRDKYIKYHCKGRLLQRHPEAVWPCKTVYTVRRDVCRKLNNKSAISFTQILFIMPVLKLSSRTVYFCKHAFSVMNYRKSKFYSQLTDKTLARDVTPSLLVTKQVFTSCLGHPASETPLKTLQTSQITNPRWAFSIIHVWCK